MKTVSLHTYITLSTYLILPCLIGTVWYFIAQEQFHVHRICGVIMLAQSVTVLPSIFYMLTMLLLNKYHLLWRLSAGGLIGAATGLVIHQAIPEEQLVTWYSGLVAGTFPVIVVWLYHRSYQPTQGPRAQET